MTGNFIISGSRGDRADRTLAEKFGEVVWDGGYNGRDHLRGASAVTIVCAYMQSCFTRQTLCDSWTVARQACLSMGFSRQEYWSGLPCPPPVELPDRD